MDNNKEYNVAVKGADNVAAIVQTHDDFETAWNHFKQIKSECNLPGVRKVLVLRGHPSFNDVVAEADVVAL